MDTIVTISQFLLSLSLLIVLHEMGHFFPAKWFKTRVEKFYLFFDFAPFNALWKVKKGETEYGIGWLPLGGYVKISGMVDESMDTEALKEPPKPWEFRSKPAWQRLIIMVGGVTVNFILGFLIFAVMLWHFGKAYIPGSELNRYGIAMDSVLLKQGFQNGDNILKLGDQPFDRFDPGVFVEALVLNDVRDVTILRNGNQQVLHLSDDVAQQITSQKIPKASLMRPRIPFIADSVVAGMPGDKGGIQKGDRIIEFNGAPIPFFDEFTAKAQAAKGQTVTLGVQRGKDTLDLKVTLSEEGKLGIQTRIDFFKQEREYYTLAQALPAGVQMGVDFLNTQLRAFGQMFKGKIAVKDNLGSLISIGKMYGTTWDWERFWSLTASLSIILAFMNLLPIPALDGGYVVFLLWEVVTGRKVSDSFMEKAVTVGFFLLLGLMIFAFGLDIWRHFIQRFF